MLEDKKILELAKKTEREFKTGYISGAKGYKFRVKDFLDVIFLYINSVDVSNPDILGKTNKNTFILNTLFAIKKIKEQVRLDIKDINFLIHGNASMGRFVARAANRKMLKDNRFAKDMDEVVDNGVDFGSGYLKVWKDDKRVQKLRSVDPYALIFDLYDFAGGLKIERIRTTPRKIMANEKYDVTARERLTAITGADEDKKDKSYIIYQVAKPNLEKGGNDLYICDFDNDLVYFKYEGDEDLEYYKWDYQKRRGFKDAIGKGAMEEVFNIIVQTKTNQKRLDDVMTIATKLPFQKEIDGERDNLVGKQTTKLKTGQILGHKGNPIEVLNTGGDKQIAIITGELEQLTQSANESLGAHDALQGKTLPSNYSGVLGNLLTENASSVHKEVQKSFSEYISHVYDEKLISYILSVFDENEDLTKYLTPNDIKLLEQNVIDYMVLQKQIDATAYGEEFNIATAREEVKNEIKNKKLISGDLLKKLREDVKGIETFISGEKISKAKSVAFIREMRTNYTANPEMFKDPFNVALLKKEAQLEAGLSELEVDQLLKELYQD